MLFHRRRWGGDTAWTLLRVYGLWETYVNSGPYLVIHDIYIIPV